MKNNSHIIASPVNACCCLVVGNKMFLRIGFSVYIITAYVLKYCTNKDCYGKSVDNDFILFLHEGCFHIPKSSEASHILHVENMFYIFATSSKHIAVIIVITD